MTQNSHGAPDTGPVARRRLLREPLVHFMAIGAILFGFYNLINDDRDTGNRIEVTDRKVAQLTQAWVSTWQRTPTAGELQSLIDGYIREEVLVREAFALGLDEDDVIIRRRLAQKMDFLTSDLSNASAPEDDKLLDYFTNHPELFVIPARVSFRQIYFNADQRGNATSADANALLAKLKNGTQVDPATQGDRFMLETRFTRATERQVARTFGGSFAAALFGLNSSGLNAPGWHGPLESGYGLHLVWVETYELARQPEFSSIRNDVLLAWQEAEQQRREAEAFEQLKARYEIVISTTGRPAA